MGDLSANPSVIRPFMPTLADMLNLFGAPSCIQLDRTSNAKTKLVYIQPNGVVFVSVFASDSERFQLTRPIFSLDFVIIESHQAACDRLVEPDARIWHGLMSLDRYENIP